MRHEKAANTTQSASQNATASSLLRAADSRAQKVAKPGYSSPTAVAKREEPSPSRKIAPPRRRPLAASHALGTARRLAASSTKAAGVGWVGGLGVCVVQLADSWEGTGAVPACTRCREAQPGTHRPVFTPDCESPRVTRTERPVCWHQRRGYGAAVSRQVQRNSFPADSASRRERYGTVACRTRPTQACRPVWPRSGPHCRPGGTLTYRSHRPSLPGTLPWAHFSSRALCTRSTSTNALRKASQTAEAG